jgi:hypothetical protein
MPRPTDDVLTSVHLPQGLRKAGLGKQLFVGEMVEHLVEQTA